MKTDDFAQLTARERTLRLRAILPSLPSFCAEFFLGIEPRTAVLTRLSYAYDLKIFFRFLSSEIAIFANVASDGFTLGHLEQITPTHLELYLEYLTLYMNNDQSLENHEHGKERKLSSVRSLFKYFFKKEKLSRNVAALVDLPKKHEKPILRLEPDETARLLDDAQSGENLTQGQKSRHEKMQKRDLAILTLMLGTGIRISECLGLNLDDIDFETQAFVVTRKGGARTVLYFSDEVEAALKDYLSQRKEIQALQGHEKALFLSAQKRRITDRAVQNMVKKYALHAAPLKKITPHKLRATFGTTLYQETGDIYLVADVLGHEDVNTTRKHYAAQADDARRRAAKIIKLRE